MHASPWRDWIAPDVATMRLVPMFGCKPFGADTACGNIHHGPVPHGSRMVCMVCHKSGIDHHPSVAKHGMPIGAKYNEGWKDSGTPTVYAPDALTGGCGTLETKPPAKKRRGKRR